VAARLAGRPLELTGDPPVPVDASIVIRGHVTEELAPEGPFGEFKVYYVEARPAPVLHVDEVLVGPEPIVPTIVAGRETGLSLTATQNEYLLYAHLRASGFAVDRVRCPLDAFGEFLTLVETPEPSMAIVEAVMERDPRTKVVIAGRDMNDVWRTLSTEPFRVRALPYHRKGKVEGERLGLVVEASTEERRPVEY